MPWGFFGNLIFAIIARMFCGNHLNKDDTSLIFKRVRFPKPQIFFEIFCTNLQSPVWSGHVGVPLGTPT